MFNDAAWLSYWPGYNLKEDCAMPLMWFLLCVVSRRCEWTSCTCPDRARAPSRIAHTHKYQDERNPYESNWIKTVSNLSINNACTICVASAGFCKLLMTTWFKVIKHYIPSDLKHYTVWFDVVGGVVLTLIAWLYWEFVSASQLHVMNKLGGYLINIRGWYLEIFRFCADVGCV